MADKHPRSKTLPKKERAKLPHYDKNGNVAKKDPKKKKY